MANQKVSREAILEEWRKSQPKSAPATYQEKMNFYLWLEKERPHLLKFRISATQQGDKWQTVHAWLNEHDLH
ncbi:MAG: hypothetical protein HY268_20290 [Deltaproteobacteria bacterium]|nr:hypothetical protein [Deltaproteobacteria bacterium]